MSAVDPLSRRNNSCASNAPVLAPAGDHAVVKDSTLLVQEDTQSRSERPVSLGAGHRQIGERSRQQVREEGERSGAAEPVRVRICQRISIPGLRWEKKITHVD